LGADFKTNMLNEIIQDASNDVNSSKVTPYNERAAFAPQKWSDETAATWCRKHKPGVKVDSLKRAGAQIGTHYFCRKPYPVIVLSVFGNDLSTVTGQVAWHLHGEDLPIFDGVGNEPKWKKMKTLAGSTSGWMGPVKDLQDAEVIWKVEGPPDMLALMAIISAELRGKHIVITNSGGCGGRPNDYLAHLTGKIVYVLHDEDQPGQVIYPEDPIRLGGAKLRSQEVASVAKECRNVQLPYDIAESHGKDGRDFICEGAVYSQFLELAAKAESMVVMPKAPAIPRVEPKRKRSAKASDLSRQQILDSLDIRAEYVGMGIEITGRSPNSKGWIECPAYGRDDQNPSGEINVGTGKDGGKYKDWGTGESLLSFDFASKYENKCATGRESFKYYADELRPPDPLKPKAIIFV